MNREHMTDIDTQQETTPIRDVMQEIYMQHPDLAQNVANNTPFVKPSQAMILPAQQPYRESQGLEDMTREQQRLYSAERGLYSIESLPDSRSRREWVDERLDLVESDWRNDIGSMAGGFLHTIQENIRIQRIRLLKGRDESQLDSKNDEDIKLAERIKELKTEQEALVGEIKARAWLHMFNQVIINGGFDTAVSFVFQLTSQIGTIYDLPALRRALSRYEKGDFAVFRLKDDGQRKFGSDTASEVAKELDKAQDLTEKEKKALNPNEEGRNAKILANAGQRAAERICNVLGLASYYGAIEYHTNPTRPELQEAESFRNQAWKKIYGLKNKEWNVLSWSEKKKYVDTLEWNEQLKYVDWGSCWNNNIPHAWSKIFWLGYRLEFDSPSWEEQDSGIAKSRKMMRRYMNVMSMAGMGHFLQLSRRSDPKVQQYDEHGNALYSYKLKDSQGDVIGYIKPGFLPQAGKLTGVPTNEKDDQGKTLYLYKLKDEKTSQDIGEVKSIKSEIILRNEKDKQNIEGEPFIVHIKKEDKESDNPSIEETMRRLKIQKALQDIKPEEDADSKIRDVIRGFVDTSGHSGESEQDRNARINREVDTRLSEYKQLLGGIIKPSEKMPSFDDLVVFKPGRKRDKWSSNMDDIDIAETNARINQVSQTFRVLHPVPLLWMYRTNRANELVGEIEGKLAMRPSFESLMEVLSKADSFSREMRGKVAERLGENTFLYVTLEKTNVISIDWAKEIFETLRKGGFISAADRDRLIRQYAGSPERIIVNEIGRLISGRSAFYSLLNDFLKIVLSAK